LYRDKNAAPPLGSCLYIGQERSGSWVVKDARSATARRFAERAAAIRFAMYECQRRPQSVIMLPGGLELDDLAETDHRSASANRRAA
jgi:hypothetical protein